jgi:3-keto-5-aminohexanoate cleavage enzyme
MSFEQQSAGPSRPDRVVLTCAITGALADRKQCPAVPYTPVEIAEETRRAWEAGGRRGAHSRAHE